MACNLSPRMLRLQQLISAARRCLGSATNLWGALQFLSAGRGTREMDGRIEGGVDGRQELVRD